MGEYQLWASLALELIGKSPLAAVHPCLIADPQSHVSLFAAAGMNVGTDVKTITAKMLFERITHITKRFDKKTQEFCENMSLKRFIRARLRSTPPCHRHGKAASGIRLR